MSARKPSDTARLEDWAWLDALVGPLDEDFVQALNEHPAPQERPSLDFFDRSDLSLRLLDRPLSRTMTKSVSAA